MTDTLGFVEGRHDMFHFMFLMVDVCLDNFADKDNLEEAVSLSRFIQWMNPKLINKKGKDAYYQYRDLLIDVYSGLIGEFFRNFLNVESLEQDVTPLEIKMESKDIVKQKLFHSLIRKFIIKTHSDFSDCLSNVNHAKTLPEFYPHHEFLRRKQTKGPAESNNPSKLAAEASNSTVQSDGNKPSDQAGSNMHLAGGEQSKTSSGGGTKVKDQKQDYARSLMTFLGSFIHMIESVKEGNGLDCFLLQKKFTR